jgi:hypothetical protein
MKTRFLSASSYADRSILLQPASRQNFCNSGNGFDNETMDC